METTEIVSKLNQIAPGTVLQKIRFGKTERTCIWLETESLLKAAEILKLDPQIGLDWLENLSVAQIDDALVFSYFLRSYSDNGTLVVRATVVQKDPDALVRIPTVRDIWPMAAAMESENAELFGIEFMSQDGNPIAIVPEKLPQEWRGFPLRKTYVFPQEVYGILHARSRQEGRDPNA